MSSVKGGLEAIQWQIQKLFASFYNIQNIFWMPKSNIDTAKVFAAVNHEEFYFIQIGANDGVTGDDLRKFIQKYNWSGILVEPVPYVFKRLENNYSDFKNLIFENSAISTETGFAKFYSITEEDLQHNNLFENYSKFKIDQLSSFDLNTVMKHSYMHPDFEKLVKEIQIPTLRFEDLLKKHHVSKIDLLQIDAEGYDFEILNDIDLSQISPGIIIFEHAHLQTKPYKILINKLRKYGYKSYKSITDTVSIKSKHALENS